MGLPIYTRPGLTELTDPGFIKEKINAGKLQPLTDKMWIFQDRRLRGRQRSYIRTMVLKQGGKYFTFDVPVGTSGVIPETAMAARMMDVEDGDRHGAMRNMYVDFGVNARKKAAPKDLADSYLWFLHPNESDIKGIDDANSKVLTILSKNQKGSGPRSVIITGGTQAQRDLVAKTINENFTVAEKKILAGNLIELTNLGNSVAGLFSMQTVHGGYPFAGRIQLNLKYPEEFHDTTIHEAVHALRAQDKSRKGALQHRSIIGADSDLEEAMTEAETVARERPFRKHQSTAGYYQFLPGIRTAPYAEKVQKTTEAVKGDRITVTKPKPGNSWDSAPKKGKRAHKAVVAHFPDMKISRLSIKGRAEAIDSFFRVEQANGRQLHVQVYAPKPRADTAGQIRHEMRAQGAKVTEFRDGTPVIVQKGRGKISGKGSGMQIMRRGPSGVKSSKERVVMRGRREKKRKERW